MQNIFSKIDKNSLWRYNLIKNFFGGFIMKVATKQNTISEILEMNPEVAALFLGHGMFCISCPSAQNESLEQACSVHGINADELLELINKFLAADEQ